jgi:hypothetical protein
MVTKVSAMDRHFGEPFRSAAETVQLGVNELPREVVVFEIPEGMIDEVLHDLLDGSGNRFRGNALLLHLFDVLHPFPKELQRRFMPRGVLKVTAQNGNLTADPDPYLVIVAEIAAGRIVKNKGEPVVERDLPDNFLHDSQSLFGKISYLISMFMAML